MDFNIIISDVASLLWGWPMMVMLLGTHLLLTVRLRFPQRKILKAIRLSLSHDPEAEGDVSQFGALATSLAATIGTGNIVGVATAVALGGPGAVLWCWLTGVLGIATKYGEGLLAVKYRVRTPSGKMLGGPMYALERGLGWRWLAVLFCVFTAVATFGIGNSVQSNAIAMLCQSTYGIPPVWTGMTIATLAALVIIFGVKGIARFCTAFVPLMALFYVAGCVYILFVNGAYVWDALCLICHSAVSPQAAGGGFVGTTVMMTARYGIARGLFSNESGMGSAPIVAAAAKTKDPVRQALVSSTGTFWDTVVICALTGLVLVSSIIAYPDISYSDGAALTKVAFEKIPVVGAPLLTFGIITFAFSTILGWSYYGERAVEYLLTRRASSTDEGRRASGMRGGSWGIRLYRLAFIAMAFLGSVMQLGLVWNLSDLMNALMAIPNLISLVALSGTIVAESRASDVF